MDNERLLNLYESMLKIRMAEERIVELYPDEEMRCPTHLSIGQEAIPAGICELLRRDDHVLSGHRSHGHYIAKGGSLKKMFAEIYGKETGCANGKGGSMHLVDLDVGFLGAAPIVGSTIPIATGAGLTKQIKGKDTVSVIFFGDAAVEEGVFHESINFANLKNLPVVFVCENNFFSVYSPLEVRQPDNREIPELAEGHGIPAEQGDGNNVKEVVEKGGRAIKRARDGGGPTFLEFTTYRWREHCGPNYDNELGYRSEEEFEKWKERCPIKNLENRLKSSDVTENKLTEIEGSIDNEINEAVTFAQESEFPSKDELSKHIYEENDDHANTSL